MMSLVFGAEHVGAAYVRLHEFTPKAAEYAAMQQRYERAGNFNTGQEKDKILPSYAGMTQRFSRSGKFQFSGSSRATIFSGQLR